MPITEDDLRQLLLDRSEPGPVPLSGRLGAVHGRIARRQRRIRATTIAAACAGVLVVVIAVPLTSAQRHSPAPALKTPEPSASATDGPTSPAAYAAGGRLIAGAVLHSPQDDSVT